MGARAISCRGDGGGGVSSPDLLRVRVASATTSSLWARHRTGLRSFIRVLLLLALRRPACYPGREGQGRALESGRGWVDEATRRDWRDVSSRGGDQRRGRGARVAASRLQGAQSCPGPPRLNARRGGYGIRTPADFSWLDLSFSSSPQGLHIIPQGCVSPDIPF